MASRKRAANQRVARRVVRAKATVRRAAKRTVRRARTTAGRAKAAAPARAPRPPKIRAGIVTHTELASSDPLATRAWCEKVLGWKFGEPMPTPGGPYHMWQFPNQTGGGIRANNPPEQPGSIPYCEVVDIRATFARALQAGATEMLAPQEIPGGMGWIAIVAVPGGVPIGFWSTS